MRVTQASHLDGLYTTHLAFSAKTIRESQDYGLKPFQWNVITAT